LLRNWFIIMPGILGEELTARQCIRRRDFCPAAKNLPG
jgi:hypothetical protein